MADRIALLNFGEIQQVGTPQELYLHPANRFTAGFLGSPEMNFLGGIMTMGADSARLEGAQPISLPASAEQLARLSDKLRPRQPVEVGIRPEHFRLAADDAPDAVSMTVETLEWLGHEVFVFGLLAGKEAAVRISAEATVTDKLPRPGDRIALSVQPDSWHAFDLESGENLLLP